NAALLTALNVAGKPEPLNVANSLWLRHNDTLNPEFVQTSKRMYGAEIGSLSGAPDSINDWVRKKTNQKIQSILTPKDINPDTESIFINTVYFKSVWSEPFPKSETADHPFTLLNGRKKICKMMSQLSHNRYYQGDHLQMVKLHYESPSDQFLSMILLLPDP